MNELKGIHHVTAITSNAEKIYDYFTHILGMRLVKKTVNQDDIHTYHLFFADDVGHAGTDITFFDFPGAMKGEHGADEISKISFRVPSNEALQYWVKRFDRLQVKHTGIQVQFGRETLSFVDFDDQRYQLISDEGDYGVKSGTPWQKGPIPLTYAITGLGPIFVTVRNLSSFQAMMAQVLQFRRVTTEGAFTLFEVGEGGNGAQVIAQDGGDLPTARQGYGSVHHAAFRVPDKQELEEWTKRMKSFRLPTSGYVERYYFGSLYTRVAPQILFEIATDGPGFMGDEPYETLGEKLSLPPFFESRREQIEKLVRPIDTMRSTKEFSKEWE